MSKTFKAKKLAKILATFVLMTMASMKAILKYVSYS